MIRAGRHHTHNFVGNRVEDDLSADNARLGSELISPNAITQDYEKLTIPPFVFFTELAAECRLKTEHVEESCGYAKSGTLDRFTRPGDLKVGMSVTRDALEGGAARW